MAVYKFTSEEDLIIHKTLGNTLETFDVIKHPKVATYIMQVLLKKHFPDHDYEPINSGTSLFTVHGHSSILVMNPS